MFTYHTEKNRFGDEHIAVSANGTEIATIKASSYYGNTEYIVSATIGGDDRGDYLGSASTIAGAKKKIRDWYSDHSAAVTTAAANSRAADLRRLPSFDNSGFYPTPSKLAGKMLSCVDWEGVFSILEPSAGKGDLADAVTAFARNYRNSRRISFNENNTYIDCIERDSDLAALLRGKGLHVIHDDFLTFRSFKQYDLCIMNPPFDSGETTFHTPIDHAVRIANEAYTNKADFTYFTCTFYKKGTCHIKFKPEASRIIDRLNIFAGQKKNWLPPTYGKKHYADMTAEEQAVIDDFQGADSYEKTIADPSMLITSGSALMALPGM